MRRIVHLMLSPASRFARLMIAEKRLACDPIASDDAFAHLPVFTDLDGTRCEGLWSIVDHLEGNYPDNPLVPEDAGERNECFRVLGWAFGPFEEAVTRRVVYEKGSQRFTGAHHKRAPDMNVIRVGRDALRPALEQIGNMAEHNGYLACRHCVLGDLAVAAQLSALDYFGEVPWDDFAAAAEWYVRMKSRPSFRSLLADRVPGQPPVSHYAELDA